MEDLVQLDAYLSEELRLEIEKPYYARVNEQARLEHLVRDREFLERPDRHVAFFSDHGVVHVRDVAHMILRVLDTAHKTLIPWREPQRLRFMKGYGVLAAYLHDIGMMDFTQFGRAMHCQYATQAVLGPDFDGFVDRVWDENAGNLAWRLTRLASTGALTQDPQLVLREMLAMVNCHSKSAVPAAALSDRRRLRAVMQTAAFASLFDQYELKIGQRIDAGPLPLSVQHLAPMLKTAYRDLACDSFAWLESGHDKTRQLAEDVVDTLRALRCADALRQRGTVQKTSGGYEVFADIRTGNAIYAMRYGSDKLYLVEVDNPVSAGEANIASSELDGDGNLRIAFHVGGFPNQEALGRAAATAAVVVSDIFADVVASFDRTTMEAAFPATVLLESVDDSAEFAEQLRAAMARINPALAACMRIVPDLQSASARERDVYMAASDLDWSLELRYTVLQKVAHSGHKTAAIDLVEGFKDVRLVHLAPGERLLEAGDPAGFVYIPLSAGCVGVPLGGYESFEVYPWIPLGVTGVIRKGIRNSSVVAEREVELLMIPRDVYVRHWHHTYGLDEFIHMLEMEHGGKLSD